MIVRDTLFYRTLVSMARQRPGLDEPRCQAMLDILSAADALRSALRHSLHYAEISELQFCVLTILLALDPLPCTPALLADHAGVSRAAITEALDRIEERKWITRDRSQEDRRTYFIRLTEFGRSVIDQLGPAVIRHLALQADGLKGKAPQQLQELCGKLGAPITPLATA